MSHPPTPRLVVVALGSNLGPSRQVLRAALERLRALAKGEFRASSLWRSSPVDCPPGSPDFVNAVAVFEASDAETPESLLATLKQLEQEFGRRPKQRHNEARPLDLDLMLFGNEIRSTPELTLPHPRAGLRRFVLEPLQELTPDLVPPGWTASIRDTLDALRTDEQLTRIAAD